MKNDYMVEIDEERVLVEVHRSKIAKSIVDELIAERKRQGLTQQDIADRTGMKAPNITRIESCKFTPTLEVLERYAMAVGKQLKFDLENLK